MNAAKAGWLRMLPGRADHLDPLAPVVLGRQVVEPQRRVLVGVARLQRHRAAHVGVHRPDVHLVAVLGGRPGAVVPDGDRQEVEHQVRVVDVVVAADEPAGLEVVGRPDAAAQEQPLGADARLVAVLEPGADRDRLLGGVLDVDLEVVLEVAADPGQVGDDRDAEPLEVGRVPMPESSSSCGELIAPPHRMTSPASHAGVAAAGPQVVDAGDPVPSRPRPVTIASVST